MGSDYELGECLSRSEDMSRRNFFGRLFASDMTAYDWAYWDSNCPASQVLPCMRTDASCPTGCYRPRVSLDAMRDGGPAYLGLPPSRPGATPTKVPRSPCCWSSR